MHEGRENHRRWGQMPQAVMLAPMQGAVTGPKDAVSVKRRRPFNWMGGITWHGAISRCGRLKKGVIENDENKRP